MRSAPLISVVYGTRPEAVKMAPVISALRRSDALACRVVLTGQHREMLSQTNAAFGVEANCDLGVFKAGQSINEIFGNVLRAYGDELESTTPDMVLVQGDTTSAAAAALCALHHRIPVAHLEAGLRSGDLAMPFPEEANRRLIAQIASLHLCPTPRSKLNLLSENVEPGDIVVTGNTVVDALVHQPELPVPFSDPEVEGAFRSGRRVIVVTAHRRENIGSRMLDIAWALHRIAVANPDVAIVLPMHKNPRVRTGFQRRLENVSNVVLTEPMDYLEFTRALRSCHIVVTDSGGVQEEAPALGKPVLVLRDSTERPEAVVAGTARLVGTDPEGVGGAVQRLLDDQREYAKMAQAINPFGDGHAASRVVSALAERFGIGERLPDFTYNGTALASQ
jgi:UDP-N-acetylglucosamine 2-epimerase (non-hydrolysing)